MTRAAEARIDLSALQSNLQRVRTAAPSSRVMAVIKANGYGHGMTRVARALATADAFGVACIEEAVLLRDAGIVQPILLLEGFYDATELDPNFGNSYNDIGAYLIQLKKYNEAIPWLKKALEAPDYENYCYPNLNLGYIYEFKGQWDLALEYYKTAIEENENYQPVLTAYEKLLGKYN